jgi:PAS domain-containing protein
MKDVGTIVKVNAPALQLLGYSRNDLEGHDISLVCVALFIHE